MSTSTGETRIFGRETLLQRVEGDEGFLAELVQAFIESQAENLKSIEAAISSADSAKLEESSHALKGALQNFCSGGAVQLAYALEIMGREGRVTNARENLALLEVEVTKLLGKLKDLI